VSTTAQQASVITIPPEEQARLAALYAKRIEKLKAQPTRIADSEAARPNHIINVQAEEPDTRPVLSRLRESQPRCSAWSVPRIRYETIRLIGNFSLLSEKFPFFLAHFPAGDRKQSQLNARPDRFGPISLRPQVGRFSRPSRCDFPEKNGKA
jgi:hypothetical protein